MNPKTALGVLTMAAPIVLLGAICSICLVWYNLTEVAATRHSGDQSFPICTQTLYMQLLNGVCTRGKVDIDVPSSCIQWSDLSVWKEMDASNLKNYQAGLPNYSRSTTASESSEWQSIRGLGVVTIPLSVINFIVCLIVADTDIELWDLDVDFWALLWCILSNAVIVVSFLIPLSISSGSSVLDPNTWTTSDCTFTAAPSFGFFLVVLGGFFAFLSFMVAVYSIFRVFVVPLKEDEVGLMNGNFASVKESSVAPDVPSMNNLDDDDDNRDYRRPTSSGSISMVPLPQTSPMSSRPHSASAVAPAPEDFTRVMLG